MKKKGIILMAVLLVVFVGLAIAVKSADSSTKMDKKNLTVVTAPEQKEAQENEQFTVPEYKSAEVKGENVALKGKASANGYTDLYTPVYANDGDRDTTSYWEGAGKGDDEITIDLKKAYNVHTVRLAVNPATLWGARKQTLSISVSEDGKDYKEIVASKEYEFDPKAGNEVTIPFDEVKAQYVRVTITKNTGAKGGQLAEFEIYSND